MTEGLQEFPVVVAAVPSAITAATPVVAADGSYALLDLRVPAGTTVPPLAHRGTTVLCVLAGELEVVCADGHRPAGVGEPVVLAADEPCRVTVLTDAHVACLVTPAGPDALVDLVEGPAGNPDDLAARLAVAGVTLLPPSWGATT